MPKLNDTQTVLLSTASQREGGSLYPLPDRLKRGALLTKAIATLLKLALVTERETTDASSVSRTDGDLRLGLFITPAGLEAIGIEPAAGAGEHEATTPPATPRQSKAADVLALLGREQGATMPELIEATGWLPHTTRAALTGLRKKGHTIERSKRDDATCYRVVAA